MLQLKLVDLKVFKMIPPEILLFFFFFLNYLFIKMSCMLECSSSIGLKSLFYIRFHGTFSIACKSFTMPSAAVSKILPHVEDQNRWRVYALNTTYPAMTPWRIIFDCWSAAKIVIVKSTMLSSAFSALFLALLVGFNNAFQISSGRLSSAALQMSTKKSGAGFNYDPSNYKDSNSVYFWFLVEKSRRFNHYLSKGQLSSPYGSISCC